MVSLMGRFSNAPARVFFGSKESFVVSRTDSQIVVVSPPFDVSESGSLDVPIRVVTGAGTTGELACSFSELFSIRAAPAPELTAVSPNSGPLDGGTAVTIFGDWFEAPVQVFFGRQEAQILAVARKQLRVIAPATASAGPIDIRVVSYNTGKDATLTGGYRYRLPMLINYMESATDHLTIHGTGFEDPVVVTIGDRIARVVHVEPDRIVVVVPVLTVKKCTPLAVIVTSQETGEVVSGFYEYHCDAQRRGLVGPGLQEP